MRRPSFPCIIVALLISGSADAQTPKPTDPAPTDPGLTDTGPTDTVTVYGKVLRDAPHLVKRFGHATSGDRLARWRAPICVAVGGLATEHQTWIISRINDIARQAGAAVEPQPCDPNLIVIVAADDVALRAKVLKRSDEYLNVGSPKPIDKVQLSSFAKDDGAPAHIFYATGNVSAVTGGALVPGYSESTQFGVNDSFGAPVVNGTASRLGPMTEPGLTRVFLVLDGRQVSGRSLQQIAAYAAMVTLAEIRIDAPLTNPATITSMFADAKAGVTPASDLTEWDKAYLRALYGTASQMNLAMQQSFMADKLKQVVQSGHAAPAPESAKKTSTGKRDGSVDGPDAERQSPAPP